MNGDHSSSSASSTNSFRSTATNPYDAPSSAPKHAMGASTFPQYPQQPWPTVPVGGFQNPLTSNNLTEFNTKSTNVMPSYTTNSPALSTALIRNLPLNTSEEQVRLITTFVTKDIINVEVLPIDHSDDKGFQAALLRFKAPGSAQELKKMLDGKPNHANNANLIVEVVGSTSPPGLRNRYQHNAPLPVGPATIKIPTGPAAARTPRYKNGDPYQPTILPVSGSVYNENGDYGTIFSPTSPIGSHLANRNHMTGKSLIENDDDDDSLFPNPLTYVENTQFQSRRSTGPHIPTRAFGDLTLNTKQGPASVHYGHANMIPISGLSNTMSPTIMGPNPFLPPQQSHRHHHAFPAANPADQNPPCNTLYVGNLPIDTSEEELKALFSKQRGYKRLCFRTKQNGPMCFVEFEDVSFATKTLHELYGHMLHNSIKGGIRLSFSKNPLGVRSGQGLNAPGGGNGPNGFTTANGPPPGLNPPPGLAVGRSMYNSSPGLNTGLNNTYTSPTTYTPVQDYYTSTPENSYSPMQDNGYTTAQNNGWSGIPSNSFHHVVAGAPGTGYPIYSTRR